MSIILEALKKATKAEDNVTVKTTEETSQPEAKGQEIQTPRADASHSNKAALIGLALILGVGFLLTFIFTGRDDTSSTATTAQNLTAEGYIPPQPAPKKESQPVTLFKPLISNPKLSLSGIVYGIGKPTAIIENKIIEEGESIKGAKVVKIYPEYVELLNESSGETFVLRLR